LRSRAGFTACAVILVGLASVYVSVPASAVQVVHPAAQGDRAPAAARPAALPNVSTLGILLQNQFNGECLDGRLGNGNVALWPCGQDGTHELWLILPFPNDPSGIYIKNVFNSECVDGRLGNGNVALWPCGQDGTHEDWQFPSFSNIGVYLRDQFNRECMDGRLGFGKVNLWPCGQDGTHEAWQVKDP
jgi:hypothetical protein